MTPWIAYHSGVLDPRSTELIQIISQAMQEDPIIEQVRQENLELEQQIRRAKIQRDDEQVKILQDKSDALVKAALGGKSPINWQENMWVLSAISRTRLDSEFVEDFPERKINIQRYGLNLQFENLRFESMVSGVRALSVWLQEMGCTDIIYSFSQLKDIREKN